MLLHSNSKILLIYFGKLLVHGSKHSQKADFVLHRFCVLIFDTTNEVGYILSFKTRAHWTHFRSKYQNYFNNDSAGKTNNKNKINWNNLRDDSLLDEIIPLQDTHINDSRLPMNRKKSFNQRAREILIYHARNSNNTTNENAQNLSSINHRRSIGSNSSLNSHYIQPENDADYPIWIEKIEKILQYQTDIELAKYNKSNEVDKIPMADPRITIADAMDNQLRDNDVIPRKHFRSKSKLFEKLTTLSKADEKVLKSTINSNNIIDAGFFSTSNIKKNRKVICICCILLLLFSLAILFYMNHLERQREFEIEMERIRIEEEKEKQLRLKADRAEIAKDENEFDAATVIVSAIMILFIGTCMKLMCNFLGKHAKNIENLIFNKQSSDKRSKKWRRRKKGRLYSTH